MSKSANKSPVHISKTLHRRVVELSESLQIIRDSLTLIKRGKFYQAIPLYGQLRSLVSEKGRKNPSLLFDIATKLSFSLDVYYVERKPPPEEVLPASKLLFFFMPLEISYIRQGSNQKKSTLDEFLSTTAVVTSHSSYSVNDIIQLLANKAGGAHYSDKIHEIDAQLFLTGLYNQSQLVKMGLSNPSILIDLIYQVGMLIYNLGLKLLKSVSEFEFFIQVYIPKQDLNDKAYILDIGNTDSSTRISLILEKNSNLSFIIQDSEGRSFKLGVTKYISFERLYVINVSYGFTNTMQTYIKIYIDNEAVIDEIYDQILSLRSDFKGLKLYQNRSFEDVNQGITIGIGQYMVTKALSPLDNQKVAFFLEKASHNNEKLVWYKRGTYGYTEPPNSDLKMQGEVRLFTIDEYSNVD